MSTIFHFFNDIALKHEHFISLEKLKDFPFDARLLHVDTAAADTESGQFPDRILRIDPDGRGGELIEFKDSRSYSIASFNSTIPAGQKDLRDLFADQGTRRFTAPRSRGGHRSFLSARCVLFDSRA